MQLLNNIINAMEDIHFDYKYYACIEATNNMEANNKDDNIYSFEQQSEPKVTPRWLIDTQ